MQENVQGPHRAESSSLLEQYVVCGRLFDRNATQSVLPYTAKNFRAGNGR